VDKADKGYHKLLVWQRAHEFVLLLYDLTKNFPQSEEYGLKGQLRRAVVSVVLNVVEGYRKSTTKDFLHFLNIAEGSLAEVESALEISRDLQFLSNDDFRKLEKKRSEIGYLLYQLITSLRKR